MKLLKCGICTYGSWAVGLTTIGAALAVLFDYPLPQGRGADGLAAILILTALGFLYYQIVPCPRCARVRSQNPERS